MDKFSLTGGFKKLKSDLSGMTFKQKVSHLWTYYKLWLIVAVLVVMGLSLVTTMIINKSTVTLCSGMLVNIEMSDEGKAYMDGQLFEQLKTGKGLEKVQFNSCEIYKDSSAEAANINYYTITSLTGLAATGELDYLIVDKYAMDFIVPHEIFMDLRKVFTQQELDAMGNAVVYARSDDTPEDQGTPIAINITNLPYITMTVGPGESDTIFLSFARGSERGLQRQIWDRLNSYQ